MDDITKEWTAEEEDKEKRLFLLHSLQLVAKKLRNSRMKGSSLFPNYVQDQMIRIADYLYKEMNDKIPQRAIWLFLSYLFDRFALLYGFQKDAFWNDLENDKQVVEFLNRFFGLTDCTLAQLRFVRYEPETRLKSEMVSLLL